jgi:hypothetical protein
MFNLYFAGSRQSKDEHILKKGACRLYSYLNDKKQIEAFCEDDRRGPLLIDSGAFSVAHSGKLVDIDEYISYINNHSHIENFIELGVIPYPVLSIATAKDCAEKSWENFLYMIDRLDEPFKLLPVFHFGENLKYLKRMLEFTYKGKHIPYICIGGRHGVATNKQESYFENIFTLIHASSNPDVKVHVLGMTVLSALEKFPFYSANSTTHLIQAAYGLMFSPYGPLNVSSGNTKKNNISYMSPEHQKEIISIIEYLGYTLEQLQEDVQARMHYNIDYTLYWAKNYEYKGPKRFKNLASLF